jgi:hypothetical protein
VIIDKNTSLMKKNSKNLTTTERELQRDILKLNAGGGVSSKFLKNAHSLKVKKSQSPAKAREETFATKAESRDYI